MRDCRFDRAPVCSSAQTKTLRSTSHWRPGASGIVECLCGNLYCSRSHVGKRLTAPHNPTPNSLFLGTTYPRRADRYAVLMSARTLKRLPVRSILVSCFWSVCSCQKKPSLSRVQMVAGLQKLFLGKSKDPFTGTADLELQHICF